MVFTGSGCPLWFRSTRASTETTCHPSTRARRRHDIQSCRTVAVRGIWPGRYSRANDLVPERGQISPSAYRQARRPRTTRSWRPRRVAAMEMRPGRSAPRRLSASAPPPAYTPHLAFQQIANIKARLPADAIGSDRGSRSETSDSIDVLHPANARGRVQARLRALRTARRHVERRRRVMVVSFCLVGTRAGLPCGSSLSWGSSMCATELSSRSHRRGHRPTRPSRASRMASLQPPGPASINRAVGTLWAKRAASMSALRRTSGMSTA